MNLSMNISGSSDVENATAIEQPSKACVPNSHENKLDEDDDHGDDEHENIVMTILAGENRRW